MTPPPPSSFFAFDRFVISFFDADADDADIFSIFLLSFFFADTPC